jgi:hypothetical protein
MSKEMKRTVEEGARAAGDYPETAGSLLAASLRDETDPETKKPATG